MATLRPVRAFLLAAAALLSAGCPKQIGDPCAQNIECSLNADRTCDLSQSGGYCTIPGCQANGCPDNAACVQFEGSDPRLARSFCMHPCNVNSDCRDNNFYECETPTTPRGVACPTAPAGSGAAPPMCTQILDIDPAYPGFCVQRPDVL